MRENGGNPPPERAEWTFAHWLDWHLENGIRPGMPDGGAPWTSQTFAAAYAKSYGDFDERTVRNWRNGKSLCTPDKLERIAKLLYGDRHADVLPELRRAYQRSKQLKPASATPKSGKPDSGIEERYQAYLRAEFEKIRRRVEDAGNPARSSSRLVILGWPLAAGLCPPGEVRRDPKIAAAELKSKWRSLLGEPLQLSGVQRREFVANLATARFLTYCYCVALNGEYDRTHLFEPIVSGFRAPVPSIEEERKGLVDRTRDMFQNSDAVEAVHLAARVLYRIGRLASKYGFVLDDLVHEELRENRTAGPRDEGEPPTHDIEFYFVDEAGNYTKILDALRNEIAGLNFLRTVSETLTPDRVAKATLTVHFRGSELDDKIEGFANRNRRMRDIILHAAATPHGRSGSR